MPVELESFELGFEVREGGEIPQAGRQQIPDSWSNETEGMVEKHYLWMRANVSLLLPLVCSPSTLQNLCGHSSSIMKKSILYVAMLNCMREQHH